MVGQKVSSRALYPKKTINQSSITLVGMESKQRAQNSVKGRCPWARIYFLTFLCATTKTLFLPAGQSAHQRAFADVTYRTRHVKILYNLLSNLKEINIIIRLYYRVHVV